MTFYEALDIASAYFTPENKSSFREYVINSMDGHGTFLRTQYRKLPEPIKDFELAGSMNSLLFCFDAPPQADFFGFRFNSELAPNSEPIELSLTTMQISFLTDTNFESEAQWAEQVGFPQAYLLDLNTKVTKPFKYKSSY